MDWACFSRYSGFVKSYGVDHYGDEVDITAFEALAAFCGPMTPWLANLQVLHWLTWSDTLFPYILNLAGPRLTDFALEWTDISTNQLSVLSTLVGRTPGVTRACLIIDEGCTIAVSDAVCKWGNLTWLSLDTVSTNAYIQLAALPSLKHLRLRDLGALAWDVIGHANPEHDGFQALDELEFQGVEPYHCIRMFNASSLSLSQLGLDFPSLTSATLWEQVLQALHDNCDHDYLEDISLLDESEYETVEPAEQTEYILAECHIAPLYAFHNLASIVIRSQFNPDLDDDTIQRMAMAWPDMRKLTLQPYAELSHPPKATILCLSYLAKQCRHLRELSLVFDATSATFSNTKLGNPSRPCRLRSLGVGASPITAPQVVAATISDLFPKLKVVNTECWPRDEASPLRKSLWSEVESMAVSFAAVREQERVYWSKRLKSGV